MSGQTCPVAILDKLLVATDGSEYSEGAIREALRIAKNCKSKLIAVSIVITNLEFEVTMPQVVEKEEKRAREHLESIKARARKESIDCDIVVFHGDEPYRDIVSTASKNNVDLIVVGRHGRTGLLRLMMGSVAAKVVGHAPCNVLVVSPAAHVEFRKILVSVDGSDFSKAALNEALSMAKRCGSGLVILSVASTDAESGAAAGIVKQSAERATQEGVAVQSVTMTGKPYEAIVEAARKNQADLIVVGSHGRRGMERLLMGSVTERVIGHTDSAVLVAKAK